MRRRTKDWKRNPNTVVLVAESGLGDAIMIGWLARYLASVGAEHVTTGADNDIRVLVVLPLPKRRHGIEDVRPFFATGNPDADGRITLITCARKAVMGASHVAPVTLGKARRHLLLALAQRGAGTLLVDRRMRNPVMAECLGWAINATIYAAPPGLAIRDDPFLSSTWHRYRYPPEMMARWEDRVRVVVPLREVVPSSHREPPLDSPGATAEPVHIIEQGWHVVASWLRDRPLLVAGMVDDPQTTDLADAGLAGAGLADARLADAGLAEGGTDEVPITDGGEVVWCAVSTADPARQFSHWIGLVVALRANGFDARPLPHLPCFAAVVSMLRTATGVIGGDSAVAHAAMAVGTPLVAVTSAMQPHGLHFPYPSSLVHSKQAVVTLAPELFGDPSHTSTPPSHTSVPPNHMAEEAIAAIVAAAIRTFRPALQP